MCIRDRVPSFRAYRGHLLTVDNGRLKLLMPPQGDQVPAFRIACIEQRALISEVVHIKDCKYCLTVRIPSVNIDPVSLALYQRCPIAVKESIAVSAEKKSSSCKVLEISLISVSYTHLRAHE